VAGFADDPTGGTGSAQFNCPKGVALDSLGNVYVPDYNNNRVRMIDPAGRVSTLAGNGAAGFADGSGGPSGMASFNGPERLTVDPQGYVYLADGNNNRIRKIAPDGTTQTFAGNGLGGAADGTGGPAGTAEFSDPDGVALDAQGNVYVADSSNNLVRVITPDGGVVTTVAGDGNPGYVNETTGTPLTAEFNGPGGVLVDGAGNIYVVDENNNNIRVIYPSGDVGTLAGNGAAGFVDGTGGASGTAEMNVPKGITLDGQGNFYVSDANNNCIRRIDSAFNVTTFAGNGMAGDADGPSQVPGNAEFAGPVGVALGPQGQVIVADTGNARLRLRKAGGIVSTVSGNGSPGFMDGPVGMSRLSIPSAVAVDTPGNAYVADTGNNRIRLVNTFDVTSTLSGNGARGFVDGTGGALGTSEFNGPLGIARDSAGTLYIADTGNNRIRKVDASGNASTLAGNGQPGYVDGAGGPTGPAEFDSPMGVAVDTVGNVYVADSGNSRIRVIDAAGAVSTLAGSGVPGFLDGVPDVAQFSNPWGLAVDAAGNVYVADVGNNRIRLVDSMGNVTTAAGNGTAGFRNGSGGLSGTAELAGPSGLVSDGMGHLFVADTGNNCLREVLLP
jgi:sugar lactone lactonase YvrE